MLEWLYEPFTLPFVQRGLLEVLVLSAGTGLIGTWIVLRGLAFYSHAVGTAAFPGLVLAGGFGFAAPLGALASAVVFAGVLERLARGRRPGYDSLTALVLVGMLALGVILASDVFFSGASVDTLLFGSLLLISRGDVFFAAAASGAAFFASYLFGRTWLAAGFDPGAARSLGLRSGVPDAALLLLIALVGTAALAAVGAILVTTLLVVPAATARLFTRRMLPWQLASVALVVIEGAPGLWLSVATNAPPGATIAMLSGGVFAFSLIVHRLSGYGLS